MRAAAEVDIAAPIETVWEILTQPESYPRIFSGIVAVVREDSGPLTTGSRWQETRRAAGVDVVTGSEIVEIAPLHRLVVVGEAHGVRSLSTQQLTRLDDQRCVLSHHFTAASSARGASAVGFKLVSALTVGITRRSMRRDLEEIRAAAEAL